MEFFRQVLINTPIWVWPLFFLLVFLGIRASKDREQPTWPYYLLPLLGIMAVVNATRLPELWLVLPVFIISYLVGCVWGHRVQEKWLLAKINGRVALKGEWLTMVIIMTLFVSNFVRGVTEAVSPAVFQSSLFLLLYTCTVALVSGILLGRSIRVLLAQQVQPSLK